LQSALRKLAEQGIKASLEANAAPRMYYPDQLRREGRPSEVCDYVVRLPDCYFDIGLVSDNKGGYLAKYDAHPGATPYHAGGSTHLRKLLGNPESPIGKLLVSYSAAAAVELAESQGFMISDYITEPDGSITIKAMV